MSSNSLQMDDSELRAAVSRSWNDARSKFEQTQRHSDEVPLGSDEIREHILASVISELKKHARQHNALQLIFKLPDEIFAAIFVWLQVSERIQAAHTCKAWARVMFSTPNIWSNVTYDASTRTHPKRLTEILRLSADSDVYLEATISALHAQDICRNIRTNMHRFVDLRLTIAADFPASASVHLQQALCTTAPRLRAFYLFDDTNHIRTFSYTDGDRTGCPCCWEEDKFLFDDEAPSLRLVKLSCHVDALRGCYESFEHVERVHFSSNNGELSHAIIHQLLASFPVVRELAISWETWMSGTRDQSPPLDLPPTLKAALLIPRQAEANVGAALAAVDHLSIPIFWILHDRDAISPNAASVIEELCRLLPSGPQKTGARVIPFTPRMMVIEHSIFTNHSMNVYMYDHEDNIYVTRPPYSAPTIRDPVDERVLMDLDIEAHLPQLLFSQVTHLDLSERVFDSETFSQPLLMFPALVSLKISLLKYESHDVKYDPIPSTLLWPTASLAQPPNRLDCPMLERLEFTITIHHENWHVPRTRIHAAAIPRFVHTSLRCGARLKNLSFVGIELLVIDPMEVEQLFALTENFQCNDGYRSLTITWRGEGLCNWG
ncbi:hypothetical protein BKA62DRAFT_266297 [Auriculariales sp. MPI-PUGE-AT-0066]|nr:hypothetical protein BKA62DRAFT_266297 [Auriculariales sp. MPI-PUGE-AT-0066]